MKKNLLIFCTALALTSLTSCGNMSGNDSEIALLETTANEEMADNKQVIEKAEIKLFPDFIYEVGPRFNVITKEDLGNVTSFADFIGEEHAQRIKSYQSLSVIILDGEEQSDLKETGKEGVLNAAQLKLLRSLDYSTNVLIWADYQEENFDTGKLEYSTWTPYLTIVPEKQASYSGGEAVLKKYLKDSTEEVRTNVDPEKLRPAKLFFTVTKNGSIEGVYLDRTSGYPDVDEKKIELITKTPGTWESAENTKGKKVNQELVVSFGLIGC